MDRFLEPPFSPHLPGFNERLWDCPFFKLVLENKAGDTRTMLLAWVDLWVCYCLMVGTPQEEARAGPWGIMDLTWDFQERRGQFFL